MTKTKFTRLAVRYPYTVNRGAAEVYDAEDRWVASVMGRSSEELRQDFPTPEEADANALLFAAAPDLYDALEQVTAWLPALEAMAPELGGCIKAMYYAKTALAKARGEMTHD